MWKSHVFFVFIVLIISFDSFAETIHVPGEQATIQAGLNAAATGDTVLVDPGTYVECLFWPTRNGIRLISAGDSINTILDGNLLASVIQFPASGGIDTLTHLSGFTIRNGNASSGGGIVCNQASPTLTHLLIENNLASEMGGGLYCYQASPRLSDVTIQDNHALEGGGMYGENASPSMLRVMISGNGANDGGGVFMTVRSSPIMQQVTINQNSANGDGGGMYLYNRCFPLMEKGSISGNRASGNGGGMFIRFAAPTLTGVMISGNETFGEGGAVYRYGTGNDLTEDTVPRFDRCTFSGNDTPDGGWSIYSGSSNSLSLSRSNVQAPNHAAAYNAISWATIDADSCWWGDSSGPYHPFQNPDAAGDTVNQTVIVNPWLTVPDPVAPPMPPTEISVDEQSNTTLRFSWQPSPLADLEDYVLYYDSDSPGPPYANQMLAGGATEWTLENLATGTTYYFTVTVVDTAGNESWYSAEVEGTTRITEAQSFSLQGENDPQHVTNHTPILTWDFFDSMGQPQAAYWIQLSSDPSFETLTNWDSGWVDSAGEMVEYMGESLTDGISYAARVRLRTADGFESGWASLPFRMNSRPSSPTPLHPVQDEILTSTVEISMDGATDDEGDPLTYGILIYSADALAEPVRSITEHLTTSWIVDPPLPDDQLYLYRLFAEDGFESSDTTDAVAFLVNATDDPPAAFSLDAPEHESLLLDDSVTLIWHASEDPDYQDHVQYIVFISRDESFETDVDTLLSSDTTLVRHGLEDNTIYWWKVRAQDGNTAGTWSEQTWSFQVGVPGAPGSFVLLEPVDGAVLPEDTVTVRWSASVDPDPEDTVWYQLDWSDNPAFENAYSVEIVDTSYSITDLMQPETGCQLARPKREGYENVGDGSGTQPEPNGLDELPDDGTIYWRVHALDGQGHSTPPLNGSWLFQVYLPEEPEAFSLLAPEDGIVLDTLAWTFSWAESSEPDPLDSLTYWLELSTGETFHDTLTTFYRAASQTSFTVRHIADDTDYWWRVHAADTNTSGTYSTQTWALHTAWPQAPVPFALLGPEDGRELGEEGRYRVTMSWEESFDPDPEEDVRYDLLAFATLPSGEDVTLRCPLTGLTEIEIELADSLNLEYWEAPVNVNWWVEAISDPDTVRSSDVRTVVLLPRVNSVPVQFEGLPLDYAITASYPNPFNPTLTIVVGLPKVSNLKLEVYNVMGQRVAVIQNGPAQAGYREYTFDGSSLASGVYYLHAMVPGQLNQVKKVVLLK